MAVSFVLPVNAQRNDNFFGTEEMELRDPILIWTATNGITNEDFNDTPLGSGLLIMVAAGAGYAVARRKRNKGVKAVIIVFVLLLGMTQCKKRVESIPQEIVGNETKITLNINNSSKYEVNPPKVNFTDGDQILVGYDGYCNGYLTYNESTKSFSGNINSSGYAWNTKKLFFYFISNKVAASYIAMENEYTIANMLDDQSDALRVFSCAQSDQAYTGSGEYTATLRNQCALVKFVLSKGTSSNVTLAGMTHGIYMDFSECEIDGCGSAGTITLYSSSLTEKWAIIMPGVEKSTTINIDGVDYDVTIPATEANDWMTIEVDNTPVFSVSSTKQVQFSPGNLQYKSGEGWRFAEHQYDYVGAWNTSNWVDLFGWGAWTKDQIPLNVSTDETDYIFNEDFQGKLDGHEDWYTLSNDEWNYLLNRDGGARCGIATLTDLGKTGLVILTDSQNTSELESSYNADAWALMEAKGSVFLPLAGRRYSTDYYATAYHAGNAMQFGRYWTSTATGDDPGNDSQFWSLFADGYKENSQGPAFNGFSVRLVRDVTPSSK